MMFYINNGLFLNIQDQKEWSSIGSIFKKEYGEEMIMFL